MVGFSTTEATIKSKHFRREDSNGEKHMFWVTVADGQTGASWGEGKKKLQTLTQSLLLGVSSLGGTVGAR